MSTCALPNSSFTALETFMSFPALNLCIPFGNTTFRAEAIALFAECLPTMHEALGCIPSTS